MKTQLFAFLFLLTHSFVALSTTASEENISIGKVLRLEFYSQILEQTRSVLIHIPNNYDSSKKSYPVLYLLDGERHLAHAILATRLYFELDVIPELIVVAIENHKEDGARENDFYHNKTAFSIFLGVELQRYVDKNYRTDKGSTLFGHSLAALFAIDLLANQSDFFNNYIVASPPLQNKVDNIYRKLMNQKVDRVKTLYLTVAAKKEEGQSAYDAYMQFVELLSANAPPKLSWEHELMEDQSHISIYYIAFFKGISKVFNATHGSTEHNASKR